MVLIGYWPLNESSGSTAYDYSGNGNHGTVNDGGDSMVPGANGILGQNAYSFDGNNDYVDISYSKGPYSNWTVSLWVNHNNWGGSTRRGALSIAENRSDKPLNWDRDDSYQFSHYRGDAAGRVMTVTNISGGWHHVVVTQTRTTSTNVELVMYWDGVEVDSTSGDYEDMSPSKYLDVGRTNNSSDHWVGRVAQLRIYNHELTASEVQYLYTASQRGRQVTSSKSS